MKKFFKALAISLALVMMISYSTFSASAIDLPDDGTVSDIATADAGPLSAIINEYFNSRHYTSAMIRSAEEENAIDTYRQNQFSDLENLLNISILSVESIPTVQTTSMENGMPPQLFMNG